MKAATKMLSTGSGKAIPVTYRTPPLWLRLRLRILDLLQEFRISLIFLRSLANPGVTILVIPSDAWDLPDESLN